MIYVFLIIVFVIAGVGLMMDNKPRKEVTIIRCPTCGDKAYLYEDGSWECTFCGDFGRMKK